jgi:hypothetical protein
MGRKKATVKQAEYLLETLGKVKAISRANDLKNIANNSKRIAFWDEVLNNIHNKIKDEN